MNPILGKLSIWIGEENACIRISGRANFALSLQFRKLLQHLRNLGHLNVVLDLSECQFMDSTFLGILAYEANGRAVKGPEGIRPGMTLLNANASVREIIQDLGVAHLVRFAERDLGQEHFEEMEAGGKASKAELNRTCLEAHELLMALHPANVEKFRDVARFFAEELKRKTGNDSPRGERAG
jgi:anti-sigma B factor antagonist